MIAFALAAIKEWRQRAAAGLWLALPLCLLAFSFRVLAPLAASVALTAAALWGGWVAGWRYGPESTGRKRLRQALLIRPDGAVAAGHLLALAASWLVSAALLAPPCALLAGAWQLSGATLARLALSLAGVWHLAGAGAFLASSGRTDDDSLLGLWLALAWFVPSTALPVLRPLNPFINAWWLLAGRQPLWSWLGPPLWLALAASLSLLGCARARRLYVKESP